MRGVAHLRTALRANIVRSGSRGCPKRGRGEGINVPFSFSEMQNVEEAKEERTETSGRIPH